MFFQCFALPTHFRQGVLHEYVSALVWDRKAMGKYERNAMLRHDQQLVAELLLLLQRVGAGRLQVWFLVHFRHTHTHHLVFEEVYVLSTSPPLTTPPPPPPPPRPLCR